MDSSFWVDMQFSCDSTLKTSTNTHVAAARLRKIPIRWALSLFWSCEEAGAKSGFELRWAESGLGKDNVAERKSQIKKIATGCFEVL